MTAEPPGGWNGAALSGLAAAARAHGYQVQARAAQTGEPPTIDPPVPIAPVRCEQCSIKDSRAKSLEELADRQAATIDSQAATIVDLNAKLSTLRPESFSDRISLTDTVKRLQEADDQYRRANERQERRIAQLLAAMRDAGTPIPAERIERWDRVKPGEGTEPDVSTSKF